MGRTSKIVGFGWSETPCKTHRHFNGVPCNEHSAFYPRINASHFSDHSHLFLSNLLPILNATFDGIRKVGNKYFLHLLDHIRQAHFLAKNRCVAMQQGSGLLPFFSVPACTVLYVKVLTQNYVVDFA